MPSRRFFSLLAVVPFVLAPAAQAEPDPMAPGKAEPAPAKTEPASGAKTSDPLAGPSVAPSAQKRTLVERDADGKIKRLDVAPAEAAVRLVNLGGEARAQVDKILAERAAMMDKLVAENLREVIEIAGAAQAGNREEAGRKMRELAPIAAPLRGRGMLGAELARVLPEAPAGEVRRMVEEYTEAVTAEEKQAAEARGETFDARAARRAEMIRLVGAEMRRAYERVVQQRAQDFDKLLATLGLTPEQEGAVRKIVSDDFTANYGKSTPEQRAKVFGEVWKLLSSEQRRKVMEHMREAR